MQLLGAEVAAPPAPISNNKHSSNIENKENSNDNASYNNTLNPNSMPRLYDDTVPVARLQAKREAWNCLGPCIQILVQRGFTLCLSEIISQCGYCHRAQVSQRFA